MAGKYDVAIIGGGMGGLITGLYLQKLGKRSIILEHGHQVGGNMSGIWRKGFYFDCGDQSMEDFGILFPVLKELDLYDVSIVSFPAYPATEGSTSLRSLVRRMQRRQKMQELEQRFNREPRPARQPKMTMFERRLWLEQTKNRG